VSIVARAGTDLRIGSVIIVTEDVFTEREAAGGGAYAWTNALHVTTRPGVIRSFLLFHEGDAFDPEKLDETERNLRKLPFLKSATVMAGEPHDGTVDVTIVTQDSWSTEPGASVESAGGSSDWGVELKESNVLGTGRALSILYDADPDRTRRGFQLHDPAFIRPYWDADFLYTNNSDGVESRLAIRRPFFSIATQWGVEILIDDVEESQKLYEASRMAQEFARDHSRVTAGFGFAVRRTGTTAHRLSFGADWIHDEFRALQAGGGLLPEAREFHYAYAGYQFIQNRWIERRWVNRDLHVEDFNLGTELNARFGVSPAAFGNEDGSTLASVSLGRGLALSGDAFALGRVSAESRFGYANRNAVAHAEGWVVRPLAARYPQTSIAHARIDWGSELDRDRQFFADGETGLRGYRLHAFEGDRVAMLNLEHRVFLGRELWHVLSPGAAAFVDAGLAGSALGGWGHVKTDVGVGLRLGLTRAPRNLFRLDVAYALDPDPRGERGFVVSFSSGQAF
jgi:outer membrane protein assembly factor BamA